MGVVMTDIAFAPDGRLFGLSFTSLYVIDPNTAAPTFIGNHGIPDGNALVFEGDDVLYAAGASSTSLYRIDPSNGASTNLGNIGSTSGGDLAFNQGDLYYANSSGQLVLIDLGPPATGAVVGPMGFSDVFGLATGDDGILYGISGTEVFSVDVTTGEGTLVLDYAGQGLGLSFGSSFFGEALPTCPSTPLVGCLVAAKAKLVVNDKARGREKFKLILKKFDGATGQADFGDPVTGGTIYEVCVFDENLKPAVRLTVDRAGENCEPAQKPCWKAKSTKGYTYKDPAAEASGVKKIIGVSGPEDKGKLAVVAGNKARRGQTALPRGIAARLTRDESAFVQVSAEGATCYEAVLGTVKKANGVQFNGKKP